MPFVKSRRRDQPRRCRMAARNEAFSARGFGACMQAVKIQRILDPAGQKIPSVANNGPRSLPVVASSRRTVSAIDQIGCVGAML